MTDISGSRRPPMQASTTGSRGARRLSLANMLSDPSSTILTSRSQVESGGEAERYAQFRDALLTALPRCTVLEISGGAGLDRNTKRQLEERLVGSPGIDAVYSMGGGNRTILDFLEAEKKAPAHFIAHDLDAENLELLRAGLIDFVLHHDLRHDLRRALRAISARHGLIPPTEMALFSDVQIVTPHNLPALGSTPKNDALL